MPDLDESDWAKTHSEGYSDKVWSITKDDAVRARTLGEIRTALGYISPKIPTILIPGCGTELILENDIADQIQPRPSIFCTDFAAVVTQARKKQLAENKIRHINYQPADSRHLGFNRVFDAVVVMNAVVAPTAADNDKMLASFHKALTPGGTMLGLFPTILCAVDMSVTIESPQMREMLKGVVDLEQGQVIDTSHDARQAFYTPLQLRKSLIAAGFEPENIKMDIFFMDSPYFQGEAKRLYGLEPSDPPIYQLYVTARKTEEPEHKFFRRTAKRAATP